MPDPATLLSLFQLLLKDRAQLSLENIALRQQLAVYKRTVKCPKIEDKDGVGAESTRPHGSGGDIL